MWPLMVALITVAWGRELRSQADPVGAALPESYMLALEAGSPIGGTVRDTRERPVAEASVYIWILREQPKNAQEHVFRDDEYHVKTDGDGRWRCTEMPDDLSVNDRLMFRLIHPDYVSEPVGYRRRLPIEALRRMTSVMVMEDGVTLTGRVVNSRGLPVRGARVFLEVPGFMINPDSLTPEQASCLQTNTDAEGRYRLGHVEPGERHVTVEAQGYVRKNAQVDASDSSEPARIRLTSVDEMERAAGVARRHLERALVEEEDARPRDIPQKWVMNGVFIVVAGVGAIWILGRFLCRCRLCADVSTNRCR
jgi:hypothetical protein